MLKVFSIGSKVTIVAMKGKRAEKRLTNYKGRRKVEVSEGKKRGKKVKKDEERRRRRRKRTTKTKR